jgi:hypothetical protein
MCLVGGEGRCVRVSDWGLGSWEGGEYAEKTRLRPEGRTFVWKASGLGAAEGSTLLFLMGEGWRGGEAGLDHGLQFVECAWRRVFCKARTKGTRSQPFDSQACQMCF